MKQNVLDLCTSSCSWSVISSPEVMGSGSLSLGELLGMTSVSRPPAAQQSVLRKLGVCILDLQMITALWRGRSEKLACPLVYFCFHLRHTPLFIRVIGPQVLSFLSLSVAHPASGGEGALSRPRKLDHRGWRAELELTQCVHWRPSGQALSILPVAITAWTRALWASVLSIT